MEVAEHAPLLQVAPPPYSTAASGTYFVPVPVYVPVPFPQNTNNQFVPFPYFPQSTQFVPQWNDNSYSNFMQFSAPMPEYASPMNSDSVELKPMEKSTTQPPSIGATETGVSQTTRRCTRCEKHYLQDENKPGACRYHSGRFVTKYRSGFTSGSSHKAWTCCSELTRSVIGCKGGSHIEDMGYTQALEQIKFMVKSTEGMRLSQPPPQYKEKLPSATDEALQESIASLNDLSYLTRVDPNEAKEEIEFPELSETIVKMNGKDYVKHIVNSSDTLPGVALKYRVGVEEIKTVNRLVNDDSLFTRHFVFVPYRGQSVEKLTPEEKEKAKEQMKQQLILRFARQVKCPVSEAKFYLELNKYNFEVAVKDRTDDMTFEKKTTVPKPISHPFKSVHQRIVPLFGTPTPK